MSKELYKPLSPKGTAIWLIDNTSLTFEQIAKFCGMHILEIKGMADGEVARNIVGVDPIKSMQLTKEEIIRCQNDPNAELQLSEKAKHMKIAQSKHSAKRYTPMARRQNKPEGILWLIKHCPELKDSHISKLIGTTVNTVRSIRDKTHWDYNNLKASDPVILGLCLQTELDKIYIVAKAKFETETKQQKKEIYETIHSLSEEDN